jgi:hypothetical protein
MAHSPMPLSLFVAVPGWRRLVLIILIGTGLAAAGCANRSATLPPHLITFHVQSLDANAGTELTMPRNGLKFRYVPQTDLTIVDLQKVMLERVQLGLAMAFFFDPGGQRKLEAMTTKYQGRMLFVFDNNDPVGAVKIADRISNGILPVWMDMPDDKLNDYAVDINESIAKIGDLKKKR